MKLRQWVGWGEEVQGSRNQFTDLIEGSRARGPEEGLQFGEGELSIGLKSGLYGGRKRSCAPTAHSGDRTHGFDRRADLRLVCGRRDYRGPRYLPAVPSRRRFAPRSPRTPRFRSARSTPPP